jgi:hypothetical protein
VTIAAAIELYTWDLIDNGYVGRVLGATMVGSQLV